ncbi:MAG TPA: two-component regulator propeller domain-containing protein [Saprospiraceae bacterium]|nr:two-component regulator propeller domain-containing protein [Saprospiraceae bacterium]HMQ81415.1 two-component regulator propeller domain-containing protein [Saprospiraceae bacterium]
MDRLIRLAIVLFTACFLGAPLSGQNGALDYRFEKLPTEIGFSNTGINDILEDHRGFLWIATWSGLAKYDGYAVKMYRQQPDKANGLQSNKVTQLFEDRRGNLWIGTNYSGFYRYDRKLDVFEQFCKKPEDMNSLSNDNVWAVFEDKDGYIWIGTERGLNRFNPDTRQFVHYENDPTDERSLSHDFVYSIAQTEDGSLWVGTEEGLNRLVKNGNEEYFIRYDLTMEGISTDKLLPHNFIQKIIPSRYQENVIWLCTSIGVKKIGYSTDNPAYFDMQFFGNEPGNPNSISHPFVPDVLEEDASHVWVATYNGLNLLNTETGLIKRFNSNPNDLKSLSNNVIMCLSKDRTGNLWIGMDKGINKLNLNAKAFISIRPESGDHTNSSIMCMIPAQSKKGIWAGSRGGGLNFLPMNEQGMLSGLSNNYRFSTSFMPELAGFITGLLLDQEGWLWVATDGAGVFRIKESAIAENIPTLSGFEQYNKKNQLSEDYVMAMLQSHSGDIWFGYWDKGLDRYDYSSGTFHHYPLSKNLNVNFQEFPIVHLMETLERGQPYLWLGTRGGGVYKLKFDEANQSLELIQRYRANNDEVGFLSSNFVNAFFIDHQNRLWVGTDSGLNLLDRKTGKFISYYERDGLASGIIQSILEDSSGNIWVSTQQGISCLTFSGNKTRVKNYNSFDGLQDNFFNDDAAVKSKAGHLIFGGVSGLSIFKPEDIRLDTIAPKIAITDFRLFNRSVPIGAMENGRIILFDDIAESSALILSHRDRVVSFEFTGLHFDEPRKLQYAYQLEGFDADWIYTDASQRIAHYTNLPFGNFVFKVKSANGDGIWSEPVEVKLVLKPPFWRTGWAYSLYLLATIALIYLGVRVTRLRAEFRHSLQLERVEREKLEEVNRLKLQFFTNISHELRTPLTLIISPLEQLLENPADRKLYQLFTRMHFNANRLLTMINQLLDLRKSEAGQMKMKASEGNLAEFGKEITASFKNMADQKNIQLLFSSEPEVIHAWFDHDQFEKVLFNLLSNAFKFTPEGGGITVSIRQHEEIEIKVNDTGVGIPADHLPHIFDQFFQVESHRPEGARKGGGTGIGLALAKMIVEKHQGQIAVESTEGEGTTFTIKLLRGKDHFSADELYDIKETNHKLIPDFTVPEFSEEAALTVPIQQNGYGRKPLILIVEDNPDIRSYLRENLQDDYQIAEAADGQEGLDKALADTPNLVLADIAMPKMDGIDLCARLKSNLQTCHVPVILLTARTSLVFKVDGFEKGADGYVTKPFNMRLLAARIRNLINSRKALQEHFAKSLDLNPADLTLNSLDEQFLSRMKLVMERHMDDSEFSVDQLAVALNMSRVKLYRKLKGLTGKSPNQIIRGFRLKRAAQLLENGQYNVSDVTYMVGYNDLRSFREQFKKEFGVSPSKYEG